jgi:hypothetical protein
MSYAAPADWIVYYNAKTLGDLCGEAGASAANLASNPRALTYLSAASGRLASACLVSKLYTDADLTEIAATAGPSQDHLKSIVCRIALLLAMENRPEKFGDKIEALRETVESDLDQLRQGKRLFVVPSRPEWQEEGGLPQCSGMSTYAIYNRNSLPTRVRNFYPNADQRQPLNRQR